VKIFTVAKKCKMFCIVPCVPVPLGLNSYEGKVMTNHSEQNFEPFAVSRRTAAKTLDCSICHIDDLVDMGQLDRVQLGVRRVGITWRSLKRLVHGAAA
jgi:hypothetical protein